ncbi:hypothetical protein [Synechococcus sp. KORDI-100]|uniref:hypothetical protein n=1 Tax=Synechococcus sp. KORDI-100 TaxID=1280380 RepID=UPI0012E00CDC|nr:hypothetical protein [Synechococcus sp. KORDI-100]
MAGTSDVAAGFSLGLDFTCAADGSESAAAFLLEAADSSVAVVLSVAGLLSASVVFSVIVVLTVADVCSGAVFLAGVAFFATAVAAGAGFLGLSLELSRFFSPQLLKPMKVSPATTGIERTPPTLISKPVSAMVAAKFKFYRLRHAALHLFIDVG